jgi:DNA-binding transcriptional MocR family regulator
MNWNQIFATRTKAMHASEIRELLKLLDQPDIISFAGGIPDPALFPKQKFNDSFSDLLSGQKADAGLQYSVSEGYAPLRSWLVDHMREMGIDCDLDNIMITSGSQQALDYLGKLFLSPSDTALVNAPTYLGALQAFRAYEPHFDQLNMNGNRAAKDYKNQAQELGGDTKFIYSSVDFANPTGKTLGLDERNDIFDLAESLDCALIEDAAYQALRYEGEALPPILALDIAKCGDINQTRTIYCGSFSKTLSPGLRVGWVCAAKDVIDKLVLIKQASDLHSPTLNQMAVFEVVQSGFDEQIEKVRKTYKSKRDIMLAELKKHMPSGVRWTKPDGGMFVWVTLPKEIDAAELLERSILEEKVAFVPGAAFFAYGTGKNTLRLNFSSPAEASFPIGIEKLAKMISKMS